MTLKVPHLKNKKNKKSKSGTTVLIGLGTPKLPRTGRYVSVYMYSRAFCSSRLRTESTDSSTSFPSVRGDQSASEAAAGLPAGFFFFHVKNFQGRIKLDETESIANTQTLGVSCCTHRVQKTICCFCLLNTTNHYTDKH